MCLELLYIFVFFQIFAISFYITKMGDLIRSPILLLKVYQILCFADFLFKTVKTVTVGFSLLRSISQTKITLPT